MTRLPGCGYDGPEPDGYMSVPEVTAFLRRYAHRSNLPVQEHTTVRAMRPWADGYLVATDDGSLVADVVVVATGACQHSRVPAPAAGLCPDIVQLTASTYRRPSQVPAGGVLVVGAGATGVQLASELRTAGHRVVLSAGRHARLPRTYRGRDSYWWLDRLHSLDRERRSAAVASPQLVGGRQRRDVDLPSLQRAGVTIVGRLHRIADGAAHFADDLASSSAAADVRLARLLGRIDRCAARAGIAAPAPESPGGLRPAAAPSVVDLRPGASGR